MIPLASAIFLLALAVVAHAITMDCPHRNEAAITTTNSATFQQNYTLFAQLSCSSNLQEAQHARVLYIVPTITGYYTMHASLLPGRDGVLEIRKSCSAQILACNDDWQSGVITEVGVGQIYLQSQQEYAILLGAWSEASKLGEEDVELNITLHAAASSPTLPPSAALTSIETDAQDFVAVYAGSAAGGVFALLSLAAFFIIKRRKQQCCANNKTTPRPFYFQESKNDEMQTQPQTTTLMVTIPGTRDDSLFNVSF